MDIGSRSRVVVGVDRDHHSQAALNWAAAEAARRGADLDVVYAWLPPHVVSYIGIPGPATDLAPCEARAKQLLAPAVGRTRGTSVRRRHNAHKDSAAHDLTALRGPKIRRPVTFSGTMLIQCTRSPVRHTAVR